MGFVHLGWGQYPRVAQKAVRWVTGNEPFPEGIVLPYGNGRSYGDQALCPRGTVVDMRGMDKFIAFDRDAGLITAQTGVTLGDINAVAIRHGWMLPVNPGTRYVTLGGAIANDVHGKNHHRMGSFGKHVTTLMLRRTDEPSARALTPRDALFKATLGGMGLTGVITQATVQLMPVQTAWFDQKVIYFDSLAHFRELSDTIDREFDYSIGWLDMMSRQRGRGFVMAANHSAEGDRSPHQPPRMGVPFTMPFNMVNQLSTWAVGKLYYHASRPTHVHYGPYFYYIDQIHESRRIYGPNGFIQVQMVVPRANAEALDDALAAIRASGQVSYLNAIKLMGKPQTPAMLSFPREGFTLAVDIPMAGETTLRLAQKLEDITLAAGGALYPAKDATMSAQAFVASFPRVSEFLCFRDPGISSMLWERVGGTYA